MTRRVTYVQVRLMLEGGTAEFKIEHALQKAIDRYSVIRSAIFTLESDQYLVKDGELSQIGEST